MWKKFTTAGAVTSIYTGLIVATLLIILSPTVWVDIVHKDDVDKVQAQIKEIDTAVGGIDAQIADAAETNRSRDAAIANMKKKEKAAAENKNAGLQASMTAKAAEKDALAAKKKDAASRMPQPIFPMKNPGIFSMGAAFLMAFSSRS